MLTFDELMDEFFFVKSFRPRSINSYKGPMRLFVAFLETQNVYCPDEVTQRHVLIWRKEALTHIRAVSWNNYARHLRAIYNFSMDQGVLNLTKNPFKGTLVKEPKKLKKTLTKEQIATARTVILEVIENEKKTGKRGPFTPAWFWQVVNSVFYYTGIRKNQIVEIQVRDIDLKRWVIHARAEGSKTMREWEVPIAVDLRPFLVRLLAEANKLGFKSDDQLFNINRFSRYHRRKTMNHWQVAAFFRTVSRITSEQVSAHRYRHSLCTELMMDKDQNLHRVKELMGHTNIKTTLEYVNVDVEGLRQCVEGR